MIKNTYKTKLSDTLTMYHVVLNYGYNFKKVKEVSDWCYSQYGNPIEEVYSIKLIEQSDGVWYNKMGYGEIIFKREKDFTMFLLRWG